MKIFIKSVLNLAERMQSLQKNLEWDSTNTRLINIGPGEKLATVLLPHKKDFATMEVLSKSGEKVERNAWKCAMNGYNMNTILE